MKRKLNKKKVIALVISILCIGLMIRDSICVLKGYTFTWIGLITFAYAYFTCAYSIIYLKENKKD